MCRHFYEFKKPILCLQFIFLFAHGFAQTYYTSIKIFGEADGFHITEGITNISQDKKGFIWISSRNGLYRFNGTSFRRFKHIASDSLSLPANEVNFCFQDRDGDYWVGVSKFGLYRYDDVTEHFTPWKNKNNDQIDVAKLYNVIAPFEDSHGQLWFSAATRGIIRINKKENTVRLFNVCDHYNSVDLYRSCLWVSQIAEGEDGWFWLCSNDGLIHFNPSDGIFKVYRNGNEFTSYFKDSEGQGWIATWGGGLKTFDLATNSWKQYTWTTAGPLGTKNIVISIQEKDKDHLWVSSLDNGLMIFDKRDGHFTQVHAQSKTDNFLSNTTALLSDRDKNIWVIAKEQLGRINGNKLLQYESLGDNVNDKTATCFLHLPNDSLLFVGSIYSKEGLHVYNLRTRKISVIPLGLSSETEDIKDFFVDSKKQIWIGTARGIYLLDRNTLKTKKFNSPSTIYQKFFQSSFDKIVEDQKQRLWFASRWWGLFLYDPLKNTIVHYSSDSSGPHHIPFNQFHYASFDEKQNLWLSMHSYLLEQPPVFCITPDGKIISYVNKIPLDAAPQVVANKNKTLVATTFSGFFEIQNALKTNETIKRYTEDNGIADTYVEGFTEDKKGNIWIATHNGLSCLSQNHIISFHMEDGLANNFLEAPPYCDDDNMIYLPFKNGFQYFNADSLLLYHQPIGPVILESLSINQDNYEKDPNQIKKLSLEYDENNLSLEFAAFDLSQGDKLQYAYQLQGTDTKWNNLGENRRLFFSNLSPGTYKLKLRAGDRFGNWSKQEFVLPITIQPPFWKTWWFYSLCLLFSFAVAYFIYKMRINSILSEQKLRNKIARDLHDDIGSTLSGIKLFSNMAQTRLTEERSEVANIVERIGERSEKMIDAMSDIVWSINPANDSIDNMLVRMKQYAAEMMEPKNINYEFYADDKVKKTRFGLETRKDIYLVFKESINNAVKYSECRNLKISLKLLRKNFEMTVSDDGKGFDTERTKTGNGLNNFRQRANNIGGEITVNSMIGGGTSVVLKVPLT